MAPETELQSFRYVGIHFQFDNSFTFVLFPEPFGYVISRIFVATWNVGGKSPNFDLNLQDFFLVEGSADIYVLGYENPNFSLVV